MILYFITIDYLDWIGIEEILFDKKEAIKKYIKKAVTDNIDLCEIDTDTYNGQPQFYKLSCVKNNVDIQKKIEFQKRIISFDREYCLFFKTTNCYNEECWCDNCLCDNCDCSETN